MGAGLWISCLIVGIGGCVAILNNGHEPKAETNTGAGYVTPTPSPVPTPDTPCSDCKPATMTDLQTALVARGYSVGPKGADGIYGHDTWEAWNKCYNDGMCDHPAPSYATTQMAYTTYQPLAGYAPSYAPDNTVWARTCPNGSCFGETSPVTGNERDIYVRPHTDKNGVHYGGSYRSHSR
jgi:hypothetical protein